MKATSCEGNFFPEVKLIPEAQFLSPLKTPPVTLISLPILSGSLKALKLYSDLPPRVDGKVLQKMIYHIVG